VTGVRWYLVILEGGPITLSWVSQEAEKPITLAGFFTTRKVWSATATEAVTLAIEDAISELRENLLEKGADAPPCHAIETRTMTWMKVVWRRYRGFTFYQWPTVH
jgi:hypothetical protein